MDLDEGWQYPLTLVLEKAPYYKKGITRFVGEIMMKNEVITELEVVAYFQHFSNTYTTSTYDSLQLLK